MSPVLRTGLKRIEAVTTRRSREEAKRLDRTNRSSDRDALTCPEHQDDLPTLVALGLLAYASADVAHHVLGHAGMCLALGGRIESISSIRVFCSTRAPLIDLAGPFANLFVGSVTAVAALLLRSTGRLLLTLMCGFNLLWFAGQMAFSAATRTDDFAWPLAAYHVSNSTRYALIAFGVLLYIVSIQLVTYLAAGYGPSQRAKPIFRTAWLAAGMFACATALLGRNPWNAVIFYAAPQSWLLSAGLLSMPRHLVDGEAAAIHRGWLLLLAALSVVAASMMSLGPGVSLP